MLIGLTAKTGISPAILLSGGWFANCKGMFNKVRSVRSGLCCAVEIDSQFRERGHIEDSAGGFL